MFVLIGFGNEARDDHGPAIPVVCPNCNNETTLRLVEVRKRFSLFFIPIFPYDWTYALVCPVCSHGLELDEEQFERAKRLVRARRAFRRGKITEQRYNEILGRSRLYKRLGPKQIPHREVE